MRKVKHFTHKIFSVKNSKTHKILTILFVKIKFKLSMKKILKQNNNKIILYKKNSKIVEYPQIKELEININGSNNLIELKEPFNFKDLSINMYGDNNVLKIDENSRFLHARINLNSGTNVRIGKGFTCCSGLVIRNKHALGVSIRIGNDCMFSENVHIRSTDGHTIFDKDTLEPINKPENIVIGDHVWLGDAVCVLKGSIIPDNSVVGAKAVVTKAFDEPNVILAGIPARIIKRNINWDRMGYNRYLEEHKKA